MNGRRLLLWGPGWLWYVLAGIIPTTLGIPGVLEHPWWARPLAVLALAAVLIYGQLRTEAERDAQMAALLGCFRDAVEELLDQRAREAAAEQDFRAADRDLESAGRDQEDAARNLAAAEADFADEAAALAAEEAERG